MSDHIRILSADPGESTGIATYLDGRYFALQLPSTDAGPFIKGFVDAAEKRGQQLLVVSERFVLGTNTAKKSRQPAAAALNGVIADHCRPLTYVTFEQQNSSEAKKLGTDLLLKRIEWFMPGKCHANDAGRHILYALLRHYPEELELVKSGGTLEINRVEVTEEEDGSRRLWLSQT